MRFLHLLFALVTFLFHGAAGQPHVCEALNGYCQRLSENLECPFGPLPATCGYDTRCCAKKPPTTDACNRMGGFCRRPLHEKCPSSIDFPAKCGINARCCKPQ